MTPEVKQKLKNILELVKRGATDGEKQAAEAALTRIIDKYNIDPAQLENLDKELHKFTFTTKMEKDLLVRLWRFMIKKDEADKMTGFRNARSLEVRLTYLDYITLSCAYEYFRRHMKAQWNKTCAPELKRCRKTKTRNERREYLQRHFFGNYIIKSNLYHESEIEYYKPKSLNELIALSKLDNIEGGVYKQQLSNGLLLGSGNEQE